MGCLNGQCLLAGYCFGFLTAFKVFSTHASQRFDMVELLMFLRPLINFGLKVKC